MKKRIHTAARKTKVVRVSLPGETKARLDEVTRQTGLSRQDVIRAAVNWRLYGEPADAARPSPCARMMLHEIIDRIYEGKEHPGLENNAAEAETLLELIRHHPGLREEIALLESLVKSAFRLGELQTIAHADFEGDCNTARAGG